MSRVPLARLAGGRWAEQEPTWREASPAVIEAALRRAQARPGGEWHVVGASAALRPGLPLGRTVAGRELVLWREADGTPRAGGGACPHLGAPLCRSPQVGDRLVCHWHGLALGAEGFPGWPVHPVHDDGTLLWVRPGPVAGDAAPPVPQRPPAESSFTTLTALAGRCEPQDVVANRLDPWHGAWFHPYAFADLRVLSHPPVDLPEDGSAEDDRFLVEVAFRVRGRFGVPVVAEFAAPAPRTVVMRIVQGEGTGSVVETHATPVTAPGDPRPRTVVTELVRACSDRTGFTAVRRLAPLLRPLVRHTANRLWRDDLAYAERRHRLRTRPQPDAVGRAPTPGDPG